MATIIKRTPAKTDIYITAGDSLRLRVVGKDANGDPLDLTGKTVQAAARPGNGSTLVPFEVSVDGDVIELFLGKTASRDLGAKNAWDCEVIDNPEEGLTIMSGNIVVSGGVSNG